jgi:hypothetical protein
MFYFFLLPVAVPMKPPPFYQKRLPNLRIALLDTNLFYFVKDLSVFGKPSLATPLLAAKGGDEKPSTSMLLGLAIHFIGSQIQYHPCLDVL